MTLYLAFCNRAWKLPMRWLTLLSYLVFASLTGAHSSGAFAQDASSTAQPGEAPAANNGQQLQTALSQASGARPVELKAEDRAILQQFGAFVQNAKYGEVWVPSATPQNWHPYMACNWVNSRQYGWYYDDKTPWGNIVHHYGRWSFDPQSGWIWIPGMEFSPGWVVWRTSPQWVGWAPVPPDQDIENMQSDAFNNGGFWTFTETRHFNSGCKGDFASQTQIPMLLKKTQYVTNFELRGGIGVFVLPRYIIGPSVEILIDIQPWPELFYQHIMLVWTFIWNQLDIVNIEITIPCNNRQPPAPPPPERPDHPPTHDLPYPAPAPQTPAQTPPQPPREPVCASPRFLDASGNCVLPCRQGTYRENGTCTPDTRLPLPPALPLPPVCAPPAVMDEFGHCVTACRPGTHPDYRSRGRHRGRRGHALCVPDSTSHCKPPMEPDGRGDCREPFPPCDAPKSRDEKGMCVCPPGMQESASGSCFSAPVACKPPLVPDGKGNCTAPPVAPTPPNTPPSESLCPDGSPRINGSCQTDPKLCVPPRVKDEKGECVTPPSRKPQETMDPEAGACPEGKHREGGACITNPMPPKQCTPPLVANGKGGCMVPPVTIPPVVEPPVIVPPARKPTEPGRIDEPSFDTPVYCPKGTHPVGRRCVNDRIPPVVPPLTKPAPAPPVTHLPKRTEKLGGFPDHGFARRCADGTFVTRGRACPQRWPIRDQKPPSGTTYPRWPRPAEKPKNPGLSIPGGMPAQPKTKVCPNGSVAPTYSRCPTSPRPPRALQGSSENRYPPIYRPQPKLPDIGTNPIAPRPIKWPGQIAPKASNSGYQDLRKRRVTPYIQPRNTSGQ